MPVIHIDDLELDVHDHSGHPIAVGKATVETDEHHADFADEGAFKRHLHAIISQKVMQKLVAGGTAVATIAMTTVGTVNTATMLFKNVKYVNKEVAPYRKNVKELILRILELRR
jgi:hypothetical protein